MVLLKKRGIILQSVSSWCVSVNWEFRKGAINSSRSWQIGIVVITLKFAFIREKCLTHLVSSLFSWNYCRTLNCLKWMKELICPLFILDSMLPSCTQETPQSPYFSLSISPCDKDWWHYMPYRHCSTVLSCTHSSSWEFSEFKHVIKTCDYSNYPSFCRRAFTTTVSIVRPFILSQWFKALPSTWISCPYKPTIIGVTVIFK